MWIWEFVDLGICGSVNRSTDFTRNKSTNSQIHKLSISHAKLLLRLLRQFIPSICVSDNA